MEDFGFIRTVIEDVVVKLGRLADVLIDCAGRGDLSQSLGNWNCASRHGCIDDLFTVMLSIYSAFRHRSAFLQPVKARTMNIIKAQLKIDPREKSLICASLKPELVVPVLTLRNPEGGATVRLQLPLIYTY